MNRTSAFGLGLLTFGMFAYGVLGQDTSGRRTRPVRLDPHSAAYKGLRDAAFAHASIPVTRQCHQGQPMRDCVILDHIRPLCLGGENSLANLQVQPCADWDGHQCTAGEAKEKDIDEIAACADVRSGRTTPEAAAKQFNREHP